MYCPTRREFSLGLVGTAAGLMFRGSDDKIKPSVFGGIQVGVQSYTFRTFTVDKMIDAMKSIGISSVELWDGHLNPEKASEADFKAMKKKLDEVGITVGAYCANFPVNSTDDHLDRSFNGALREPVLHPVLFLQQSRSNRCKPGRGAPRLVAAFLWRRRRLCGLRLGALRGTLAEPAAR